MDTFSSSVQSLALPGHHSTPRHELLYPFKTSNISSHLSSHSPLSSTNSTSNCKLTTPFTGSSNFTTVPFAASSNNYKSSFKQYPLLTLHLHSKAASGYAAALVDVARCNHSLEAVERDVRRFSKWLGNSQLCAFMFDPLIEESEKGQVVKEVAKKGRLHRHLMVLVKLLVHKNKVGLIKDVLREFERIYDELTSRNRTPLVLV